MFGTSVQKEVERLREENRELKFELNHAREKAEVQQERALDTLRKEMQESLIKSDLLRVEALAKLEVYEKTDTKADANTIKQMIGKLIDKMGSGEVHIVK